jgi:hypothetical protein
MPRILHLQTPSPKTEKPKKATATITIPSLKEMKMTEKATQSEVQKKEEKAPADQKKYDGGEIPKTSKKSSSD